jgi:hypothetical protein
MYAHLADSPTDQEIDSGVSKMGIKKSGADAEIPAGFYKALARDEKASKYLRAVIRAYWESGSCRERKVPPPAPAALTAQPPAPPQPPRRSGRATAPSAASLIAIANAPIRHRVITHTPTTATTAPQQPPIAPLPGWTAWDNAADALGERYDEWLVARMKLLPKKGDLAQCKNRRAICLLDIASKILSCVIVARLNFVQEKEGIEEQTLQRQARHH